jgi:hypothetical protein
MTGEDPLDVHHPGRLEKIFLTKQRSCAFANKCPMTQLELLPCFLKETTSWVFEQVCTLGVARSHASLIEDRPSRCGITQNPCACHPPIHCSTRYDNSGHRPEIVGLYVSSGIRAPISWLGVFGIRICVVGLAIGILRYDALVVSWARAAGVGRRLGSLSLGTQT